MGGNGGGAAGIVIGVLCCVGFCALVAFIVMRNNAKQRMAVAMYQPLGNGPVAPISSVQPMQPNVIVTNPAPQVMVGQPVQPQYVQPQMQMQTQPIPQPQPMMMMQPQQPVRNVVVQQPQHRI